MVLHQNPDDSEAAVVRHNLEMHRIQHKCRDLIVSTSLGEQAAYIKLFHYNLLSVIRHHSSIIVLESQHIRKITENFYSGVGSATAVPMPPYGRTCAALLPSYCRTTAVGILMYDLQIVCFQDPKNCEEQKFKKKVPI